jgi:predicted DNA-binding protein YlxM (UPF0122 family)
MPTLKLTDAQKLAIRTCYVDEKKSITEIAKSFEISPRTIGRVLAEFHVYSDKQIKDAQGKAALKALAKNNVSLSQLEAMLIFHKDGPTRGQVVKYMSGLNKVEFDSLIGDVVTARAAKDFNVKVQTTMLNITNKVEKDAH